MDESFCWGLVVGAVLTGAVGYAAQRMQLAGKRARAADMKTPIAGTTQLTPREMVRMARRARVEVALWIVGLLALVACIAVFLVQSR